MSNATYQLQPFCGLLSHAPGPVRLLHDYLDEAPLEIEALVASGDCFIDLATALDGVTESLPAGSSPDIQPALERVIRALLYLQRHYQIVSKTSDHRQ